MPDNKHIIKRAASSGASLAAFEAVPEQGKRARIPGRMIPAAAPNAAAAETKDPFQRRIIRAAETSTVRPAELYQRELRDTTTGLRRDERKGAPPKQKPKTAEALKEEWDAAWQARLDAAVAAAREEAYSLGYAEAQAQLQGEYDEYRQAIAESMSKLETAWARHLEKSEPLLVELSFDIAQAVLDASLPGNVKAVVARALAEAVEQLAGSGPIEVALHPVEFLRLQESGLVDQLESLHAGIRWEPRAEMRHGEWAVQSPVAAIRRLEDELLGTLKNRLGLLAVAEKRSSGDPEGASPLPPAVDR